MEPQAETSGRGQADELLEASWAHRDRPVEGRERYLEIATNVALVLGVAALMLLAPSSLEPSPMWLAVVAAYAVAARAEFPIGAGIVVPTQLFLVPLFALAPAQIVPALVFAGLLLSGLAACLTGRSRLDRLIFCAGNSVHAVGPALVLVLLADGDATTAAPLVVLLAFLAQLAFDFASSSLHDLLVYRVRPEVHARVLLQVWGIDAALTPLGLLAAQASQAIGWAALAPVPLVGVLTGLANDRTKRIARAHERLEALQHERRRHQAAVQRIGDAFASNLDRDALLASLTGAVVEALGGRAARGSVLEDGALVARTAVGEAGDREAVLGIAERSALRKGGIVDVEHEDLHALAGVVGAPGESGAIIAVARDTAFSDEEREVLRHLCQQAAVSAEKARQHELLRVAEARLRHQAFHDTLTGLANRALFVERVERALRECDPDAGAVAVLFLDLDGFKLVNDTLGHDAGDELLVAVARRVSEALRPMDTPARFGGDEFAVLLEDLETGEQAGLIAERLRRELARPIVIRGRDFVVRGSIGLAVAHPGVSPDDLLRQADLAMYDAKRDGGNEARRFHDELLHRATTRIELAQDLRVAVPRGELELRFQPIVDLASNEVRILEALVRWRHPRRGLLGPEEFIALAEETGTIDALGRFVLDEACRVCARGLGAFPGRPGVSVNVSTAQLRGGRLVGDVVAALRRHELSPSRLVLEVTESMAVKSDAQALATLHELRELGVVLALDDFGTGYSSLSHLARFPVDLLKLDRTFLAGVVDDPVQARLVGGVMHLARSLELPVVAEGIERPAQLAQVVELGGALGQGYLFGRPMNADVLPERLLVPARAELVVPEARGLILPAPGTPRSQPA